MKIGTTTFAFRYEFLDRARAPSLECVVARAGVLGLDMLQICENARPLDCSDSAWRSIVRSAEECGIELQLGCKTLREGIFARYIERAATLPARFLRVVLEEDDGAIPTQADIDCFLARMWPRCRNAGVRVAIENHFDIPSRLLAEALEPYPVDQAGFCLDTANSLRNFESPEAVFNLLGGRAFCYHLKDFRVTGDQLGFRVSGARLGEGNLDLDGTLDRILRCNGSPEVFLENWVPATGNWETDIREDEAWLRGGIDTLVSRLTLRGIER